jgi:pimeloyl-ACP methyl ester carboxylesterase
MFRRSENAMSIYGELTVRGAKICFKVRGRGPGLLVLHGGGGNADASDGMAAVLESELTVVSYDRRGLLRSPLDGRNQALSVEQHAEDALALLDELSLDSVYVMGSSLGALIGLELVAHAPERVKLLVAHEPPAPTLLSELGQTRVAEQRRQLSELALLEGPRAALRQLLVNMGIDREDREGDAEPPPSSRLQSRETGFLLTRETRATDRFRLDLAAIRAHAHKIVPAFGASSRHCFAAECALALASELGREPVEFPGGHTAYVLRPRAFAETLRGVLGLRVRESYMSFTALGRELDIADKATG